MIPTSVSADRRASAERWRTILIIDDESGVLDLCREILEREGGYQVVTAYRPSDGVELAFEVQPDLILLDITMPRINGWEVMRVLKSEPETQDIPIAVLTVRNHMRDKLLSLKGGALDFLQKPEVLDDLPGRVRRIFERLEREAEPSP